METAQIYIYKRFSSCVTAAVAPSRVPESCGIAVKQTARHKYIARGCGFPRIYANAVNADSIVLPGRFNPWESECKTLDGIIICMTNNAQRMLSACCRAESY
jgi:hypothetical protein